MQNRPITIASLIQYAVRPDAPFDIDYPALRAGSAICIGLSIDWQHMETLRAFAARHTHEEERKKAARFLHPEDGLRHLLGRALLRNLAIHYDGMQPGRAIPLNAFGKPEPTVYPTGTSVSHAGNQIWAAIARCPLVGIDVESAVAPADYRDIMRGFHPNEISMLQMDGEGAAMMRCWSRKEAVAKAIGMGFSLPLDHYAVDCGPVPSNWLRVPPPSEALQWTTIDLPVDNNHVGALAVASRCDEVTIIKLKLITRDAAN